MKSTNFNHTCLINFLETKLKTAKATQKFVDLHIDKLEDIFCRKKYKRPCDYYNNILMPALKYININSVLEVNFISRIFNTRKVVGWQIHVKFKQKQPNFCLNCNELLNIPQTKQKTSN